MPLSMIHATYRYNYLLKLERKHGPREISRREVLAEAARPRVLRQFSGGEL